MPFSNNEEYLIRRFENLLKLENEFTQRVLKLYVECITLTNDKKKTPDSVESDVLLMLGSNLSLLSSATLLLKRGYYRPVIVLFRSILESIVLAMYFVEFQDTNKEYREKGHRGFFKARNNKESNKQKELIWLDALLEDIKTTGNTFAKLGAPWFDALAQRIKIFSRFSHVDLDAVHLSSIHSKKENVYSIGPQEFSEEFLKTLLEEIWLECYFSLMVLQSTIGIVFTDEEDVLLKKCMRQP